MSGMQPGIPDVAWVYAAGVGLAFGALAAAVQLAWRALRGRR